MKKLLGVSTILFTITLTACSSVGKCPTQDQVKTAVKGFIPQEFNVESISSVKDIPGLCEVVIKVGAQPLVFYTDSKANYIMAGNLISVKDSKNLTRERQQEFMKVEKNLLNEVEKLVDFTYGSGSKYVYYITDPDCPFCKRSEPILKDWADKNNVQVKVILFPLPIHPEAFGKSASLICEKRGFVDLMTGNYGTNQCDQGKAKVQQNIEFLAQRLGIGGTPTFIGMNGLMHSGVPEKEDLDKLVK